MFMIADGDPATISAYRDSIGDLQPILCDDSAFAGLDLSMAQSIRMYRQGAAVVATNEQALAANPDRSGSANDSSSVDVPCRAFAPEPDRIHFVVRVEGHAISPCGRQAIERAPSRAIGDDNGVVAQEIDAVGGSQATRMKLSESIDTNWPDGCVDGKQKYLSTCRHRAQNTAGRRKFHIFGTKIVFE
jgi:hypothetical protein